MHFLELIKSATTLAQKEGLELQVTLTPIRKPFNENSYSNFSNKGDVAVDAQPLLKEIFKDFISKKEQASEDIVHIFFEKIRTEEKLFAQYTKLKEKYGTKILNPGLARSVAEFLGLKNRGAKVLVEDKKCLIKSYTKLN